MNQETPAEKAARLGVVLLPAKPEPKPEPPTIAVCGKCDIELTDLEEELGLCECSRCKEFNDQMQNEMNNEHWYEHDDYEPVAHDAENN